MKLSAGKTGVSATVVSIIGRGFVREVVQREVNRYTTHRLAQERSHLRPLPKATVRDYTTHQSVVASGAKRTYSVPSRLIGRARGDVVEVRHGATGRAMPRLRGADESGLAT